MKMTDTHGRPLEASGAWTVLHRFQGMWDCDDQVPGLQVPMLTQNDLRDEIVLQGNLISHPFASLLSTLAEDYGFSDANSDSSEP